MFARLRSDFFSIKFILLGWSNSKISSIHSLHTKIVLLLFESTRTFFQEQKSSQNSIKTFVYRTRKSAPLVKVNSTYMKHKV